MSSEPAPGAVDPRPRRASQALRAARPGTRSGDPVAAPVPTAAAPAMPVAVGAPVLAAFAAAALVTVEVEAQGFVTVPPSPDQPVAEGFDPDRALFFAEPNFIPLRNPEWTPLEEALDDDVVAEDAPVLLFEAGGETLVLVTSQMSYHHVAQGDMAGEPWMVTF